MSEKREYITFIWSTPKSNPLEVFAEATHTVRDTASSLDGVDLVLGCPGASSMSHLKL